MPCENTGGKKAPKSRSLRQSASKSSEKRLFFLGISASNPTASEGPNIFKIPVYGKTEVEVNISTCKSWVGIV